MDTGSDWPDPRRPGIPLDPERPGPHLLVDMHRTRRWGWWSGFGELGGWYTDGREHGTLSDWTYIGPALAPDGKPVP
jgi:hypothetical protein